MWIRRCSVEWWRKYMVDPSTKENYPKTFFILIFVHCIIVKVVLLFLSIMVGLGALSICIMFDTCTFLTGCFVSIDSWVNGLSSYIIDYVFVCDFSYNWSLKVIPNNFNYAFSLCFEPLLKEFCVLIPTPLIYTFISIKLPIKSGMD